MAQNTNVNTVSSLPARSALAVTPNDSTDLPGGACRGLYVGGGGTVTVIMPTATAGDTVPFVAVPAGSILPISAQRVMATGTTATSIVALY